MRHAWCLSDPEFHNSIHAVGLHETDEYFNSSCRHDSGELSCQFWCVWWMFFIQQVATILVVHCDLDPQRNTRARIYRPPQKTKWAKPVRISIATPTSSQEFSLGLRSICVLVGSMCVEMITHSSFSMTTDRSGVTLFSTGVFRLVPTYTCILAFFPLISP